MPSKAHMMLLAIPLVFGLGAVGYAAGMTGSEEAPKAPACAVDVTENNGAYALEAQFFADRATTGRFAFTVKSVGGSNSSTTYQGGGFSATKDHPVTLGRMTLGGNAAYDVTLTVEANGKTYECREHVGQSA